VTLEKGFFLGEQVKLTGVAKRDGEVEGEKH
jgi:hypothetical protein